jgi:hypothetical protein
LVIARTEAVSLVTPVATASDLAPSAAARAVECRHFVDDLEHEALPAGAAALATALETTPAARELLVRRVARAPEAQIAVGFW